MISQPDPNSVSPPSYPRLAGASLLPLGPESRLREVYEQHYVPHCLEDPDSRNTEGYRRALDLWESLTGDPPIGQVTALTLSDFKIALGRLKNRKGKPVSPNTVRKQLSHVQWILDQCGPTGRRQLRTALEILPRVPYTKIPKRRETYKPEVSEADILALFRAASQAEKPVWPGLEPGDIMRATLGLIMATTLRIGQIAAIPYDAVDWEEGTIVLSHAICRKSKKDEPKPIPPIVMSLLRRIQGRREMLLPLFPLPHSKTTIYDELHRLRAIAEVPHFAFHDMRATAITSLSFISEAAAQYAAGHSAYSTTRGYQKVRLLKKAQDQLPLWDLMAAESD